MDLYMNSIKSVGNLSILMIKNLEIRKCKINDIRNEYIKRINWLN